MMRQVVLWPRAGGREGTGEERRAGLSVAVMVIVCVMWGAIDNSGLSLEVVRQVEGTWCGESRSG